MKRGYAKRVLALILAGAMFVTMIVGLPLLLSSL